jgi:hypothetical protein
MPRNVVVFSSTDAQDYYDINLSYVGAAVDAIGALFQMPTTMRRYVYRGRLSIIQILYLLWPMLEMGSVVWQEWYVFQNNYGRDPPNSATLQTRHSMEPSQWMRAIVQSMNPGPAFYASFWDFCFAPLFLLAENSLNHMHYTSYEIAPRAGPHEWLWPCLAVRGPRAFPVLLDLIRRTQGTEHPVPMLFAEELLSLYNRWQPVARM